MAVWIYRWNNKIRNENDEEFKEKFGSLFEEFKNDRSSLSSMFYSMYFFRRTVYVIIQVFMNEFPRVQAGLNIAFSIYLLGFLLYYRPFKDFHIQISNTCGEICVFLVFCLVPWFYGNYENQSRTNLESSVIYIVLLSMAIQVLVSLYSFLLFIQSLLDKLKKFRAKKYLKTVFTPRPSSNISNQA